VTKVKDKQTEHHRISNHRLVEEKKKKEETTGQKYNVRICYAGRP